MCKHLLHDVNTKQNQGEKTHWFSWNHLNWKRDSYEAPEVATGEKNKNKNNL